MASWTVGCTWGRWVNTSTSADSSFLFPPHPPTHLHQETVKALWAQLPSTPVHSGTFLGRAGLAMASWCGPQCVGAPFFPEFGGSGAAGPPAVHLEQVGKSSAVCPLEARSASCPTQGEPADEPDPLVPAFCNCLSTCVRFFRRQSRPYVRRCVQTHDRFKE